VSWVFALHPEFPSASFEEWKWMLCTWWRSRVPQKVSQLSFPPSA
jgi:hypothetical protein